ncbi:MAG: hypothetical protein Q8O82_05405 [Pseudorhodobacter sp.]|nr:hypothetical protein [Pseudorhodobacter sp.]
MLLIATLGAELTPENGVLHRAAPAHWPGGYRVATGLEIRHAASLFVAGIVALPLAAAAETRGWIPVGITLPEPHEVLMDQQIGSNTHILQIAVETDPTPLFADWRAALEAGGYDINDSMLFDGRLLFSGSEIEIGGIAVQSLDDAEFMIQIDVTKAAE